MKAENDTKDIGFTVFCVALVVVFVFQVAYISAHYNGYRHGATIAQLYHEETGVFPSETALMEWESKHWPELPQPQVEELPYRGRP